MTPQKNVRVFKNNSNSNDTTFIHGDFSNISLDKKFDLITAFRFFQMLNLFKKNAMEFISKNLSENGILIFNNHKNFWSIPFFIERLTFEVMVLE